MLLDNLCSLHEHKAMDQIEVHFKVLRHIEKNPHITQRQLAKEMGISLGKLNYVIRALIDKGMVKGKNFKNRKDKRFYSYLLTSRGIEEKSRLTVRFLRKKMQEFQTIKNEIDQLKAEMKVEEVIDRK